MDYFRQIVSGNNSGAKDGVGNQDDHNEGVETVERLVDRLQSSTLYEDRRDAYRALRSLAKKYRLEVGSIAMASLTQALREKNSPEIISIALDALCCIIGETEEVPSDDDSDELGERFAEILIKDAKQVSLILSLLEEYEFSLRRPAMHLVTGLLRHCPREMQKVFQEILLCDPNAVPRMVELLGETREVLRNDAVLMLGELTRGNASIQKLVAYQNAFQMLLDTVVVEPENSIVTEDCMFVVLNLLKNNASNQELFREHSLIQQLALILRNLLWPNAAGEEIDGGDQQDGLLGANRTGTNPDDMGQWTTQRVTNVIFVFQAIRCLVAPTNTPAATAAAQKIMHDCGLLADLCRVLMASGVTVEVLSESIVTVAEVIRGCARNQQYFQNLHAPDSADKTAVLVLLMSMANEKQPPELRCAVLYCFEAYLYKNSVAKNSIVSTLLPSSADANQATTPGHYLCTMLVSTEPIQVWLGAVCLMHCIFDEPSLKEQLLRVQVATSLGSAPQSLLQQVMSILTHAGQRRALVRAGLLMLLVVWLAACPVAVVHLLHRDDNVTYLTEQVAGVGGGAECDDADERVLRGLCALLLCECVAHNDDTVDKRNRQSMLAVIDRRIGVDAFVDCVESVSRSESYVRATQRTQPIPPVANTNRQDSGNSVNAGVVLDYEFTRLLKKMEADLMRPIRSLHPSSPRSTTSVAAASPAAVQSNVAGRTGPLTNGQTNHVAGTPSSGVDVSAAESTIVQSYKELIKRQDTQLAELTAQVKRAQNELNDERQRTAKQKQKTEQLESDLKRVRDELDSMRERLATAETARDAATAAAEHAAKASSGLNEATSEMAESARQKVADLAAENAQLKTQLAHEATMLQTWQAEVTRHQQFAQQWQQYSVQQLADPTAEVVAALQQQIAELESQLAYGFQMFDQQAANVSAANEQAARYASENELLKHQCGGLTTRIDMIENELKCERVAREDARRQLDAAQSHAVSTNASNAPAPATAALEEELRGLRREQEDLLLLLADQDSKLREYRQRMKHHNMAVSEDDDDEDEPQQQGMQNGGVQNDGQQKKGPTVDVAVDRPAGGSVAKQSPPTTTAAPPPAPSHQQNMNHVTTTTAHQPQHHQQPHHEPQHQQQHLHHHEQPQYAAFDGITPAHPGHPAALNQPQPPYDPTPHHHQHQNLPPAQMMFNQAIMHR